MKRPLLNLLTALSLLLCVAVVALWVRSAFVPRTFVLSNGLGRAVLARSAAGSLQVGRQSVDASEAAAHAGVRFTVTEPGVVGYAAPGSVGSFGNGWHDPRAVLWSSGWTDVTIPPHRYRLRWSRLRVPYRWLALATAAVPAARFTTRTWRRRRSAWRHQNDLCPSCGYDLRATPGRCPECGTDVRPA